MFTYPIIGGCNTQAIKDYELLSKFNECPSRYSKVAFNVNGPVFAVTKVMQRVIHLRMFFADGSYSDSSHKIDGSTVLVLQNSLVYYNEHN